MKVVGSLISENDLYFHDVANLKSVYDPNQVDKFTNHFSVELSEPLSVDIVYQSFHR